MGFNYTSIRVNVVVKQIANFGKDAVLTQPGTPTGPSWAPIPGTAVTTNVKVIELGPPGSAFSVMNDPQSLMRVDDRRFLMSTAGGPVPTLNSTLTVGGDTMQIVNIDANQPGSVIMFWRLRCRR